MATPTRLLELLATLGDQAGKLSSTATMVYDRADPDELADFPMFVGNTAGRMLVTLDDLVEHLGKLGLVAAARPRGEATR